MVIQQIVLLIINILGGIAVIGSYILGLRGQSGGANILWGEVPVSIRPVYTISMVISAVAYFIFIYYILFRINPKETTIGGHLSYSIFYVIFFLMLAPSALWMPLTNMYVLNQASGTWFAVRTVLFIVGLASIGLFVVLLTLQPKNHGLGYWSAVGGSVYFAFHTFVLDALVWAYLFK
jgi:hypothetical protein